jgi:hypothetical protein
LPKVETQATAQGRIFILKCVTTYVGARVKT